MQTLHSRLKRFLVLYKIAFLKFSKSHISFRFIWNFLTVVGPVSNCLFKAYLQALFLSTIQGIIYVTYFYIIYFYIYNLYLSTIILG